MKNLDALLKRSAELNEKRTLEKAYREYLEDAARCCDSCVRTAEQKTYETAFSHGWNKAHKFASNAALLEIIRVQKEALKDCVTLMSGAPSVAPLTDDIVLKRSRSALEQGEEIASRLLGGKIDG